MKRSNWMLAAAAGALLASTTVMAAPKDAAPNRLDRPNGPRAGAGPMAQAGGPMGAQPGARMAMRHPILAALARLDLTPAQKTRIKGIMQATQQRVREIRQNTSLTPGQKQERVRAARRAMELKVRDALTPAQRTKLAAMMRRMQGERMMMGYAALLQRLDLTPDQKTQIQNLIKDARAKAQIIRESKVGEQDKRAQLRTLMQATRKNVIAVLTPEQRRKAQEIMRQREQMMRERRGRA